MQSKPRDSFPWWGPALIAVGCYLFGLWTGKVTARSTSTNQQLLFETCRDSGGVITVTYEGMKSCTYQARQRVSP